MKFDLLLILKHFTVSDGRLYRRLSTGHVRPVRVVERGRLVSMLNGVKLCGPEVAYACLHRVVPMFPIVQIDSDPFNMAETNLSPARTRRLRFRCVSVAGGFRHPRSHEVFKTEELAHIDWVNAARLFYQADKAYVRALEDQNQVIKPEALERVAVRRVRLSAATDKPLKPKAVAGRSWHWWKGAWLSLPEAVHSSDDWMVRAAVVTEHPSARFVYDPVQQRTLSVV